MKTAYLFSKSENTTFAPGKTVLDLSRFCLEVNGSEYSEFWQLTPSGYKSQRSPQITVNILSVEYYEGQAELEISKSDADMILSAYTKPFKVYRVGRQGNPHIEIAKYLQPDAPSF